MAPGFIYLKIDLTRQDGVGTYDIKMPDGIYSTNKPIQLELVLKKDGEILSITGIMQRMDVIYKDIVSYTMYDANLAMFIIIGTSDGGKTWQLSIEQ